MAQKYDAVVVGAGPNGLAAAITIAQAGRSVALVEATDTVGGGMKTAELTLPGFHHDICSAVHPFAVVSPFFASLPLQELGLTFIQPDFPLAHPLDNGRAGVLRNSLEETAFSFGEDSERWKKFVGPVSRVFPQVLKNILRPVYKIPTHPVLMARVGMRSLPPATYTARRFHTEEAAALFGGTAAHAFTPLNKLFTSSFALVLLACGNNDGWPIIQGGSQQLANALATHFQNIGGDIITGQPVTSLSQLPASRVVLFDLTPKQVLAIAPEAFSERYGKRLRKFRYGMAAFKVDYALSEPVPWTNPDCRRAGTVHVCGTFDEIAAASKAAGAGQNTDKPFVLVSQPSVFDATRAPNGKHTLWAYAQVPQGSDRDWTEAIENQIERFAPGFRDTVLARHVASPQWLETHNENYIGGDIGGGSYTGRQLFFRPTVSWNPYRTSNPNLFFCSASTPPGAGVHGMCGFGAATSALHTALR